MNNVIYYYSATGNSLDFARRLAEGLGEASLIPLAQFRNQAIRVEAARVGFVFPVYAWGPPRTVEEALSRMDLSASEYVFAVACCGGTACNTLPQVNQLLRARGRKLDAGFVVSAPSYVDIDPESPQAKAIEYVRRHAGAPARPAEERLAEIVDAVTARRSSPVEQGAAFGSAMASFFNRMSSKQMRELDRNYLVSEACKGCGFCTRICPRENIELERGRPLWKHDCDGCGACVTWCPQRALSQNTGVAAVGRHHERVSVSDMLIRR